LKILYFQNISCIIISENNNNKVITLIAYLLLIVEIANAVIKESGTNIIMIVVTENKYI